MEVYRSIEKVAQKITGCALTIGNFDGVHIGHQALLQKLVFEAKKRAIPAVLLTFDPHPMKVLHSQSAFKELFPVDDLIEQGELLGLDAVVVHPFTKEFSQLSGADFLQKLILPKIKPKYFLLGPDFRFGHGREDDQDVVKNLGAQFGYETEEAPVFLWRGEKVSSSRIRQALAAGHAEVAAELLGRPFELRGEVVRGDGRGKTIGFPTANLQAENETIPAPGVYVTELTVKGQAFAAVTNIGFRPTFGPSAQAVETYAFNLAEEIYKEDVRLRFLKFLRPEMRFSAVEELKKQIQLDVTQAKKHFGLL